MGFFAGDTLPALRKVQCPRLLHLPTVSVYAVMCRPFEAAMPPPKHVHPGRLVVTKPDLPEQPRSAGADAGPPPGCGHRTLSAGLDTDRCRCA